MSSELGPDRLLPADSHTTVDRSGAVLLRTAAEGVDAAAPLSVPSLLARVAAAEGAERTPALAVKRDGKWLKWSYKEYLDDVRSAAKAFIKFGLEDRHGVGIIGFNSPEWFIADLASVHAGGLAAGIYPTNSPEACRYIMDDCRANVLVAEDAKQLSKFLPFVGELQHLRLVVQWAGEPDAKTREEMSNKAGNIKLLSWRELIAEGKKECDQALEDRLKKLAINQCCHLVYTSGTTGPPKGVMLSHDNLTFTSRRLCEIFDMKRREERLVSYLPLSHVAANICDLFVMLSCEGTVYFADKDALKGTLTHTLKEALPTLFFGVPRVWEKIHEKLLEVGRQNKGFKRQVGDWAKRAGLEHNRNLLNAVADAHSGGGTGGISTNLKYKLANAMVFQKVKSALGLNKCLRFYVAAAPMARETLEYFLSLDIRILEFYGMSECSGPQLCNVYDTIRIGTNGRQLPGFWHRVDPQSGELLAKGRHVMMGYLGSEEKTEEVFDEDGWLKSGDIGKEDSDGYVTVTGRIKELIITAGGENVPPVVLEDNIKAQLPDILSNVVIVGDRRKFLSCLLTLKSEVDQETLQPLPELTDSARAWCETAAGSKAATVAEAAADPAVQREIQTGIDRANALATSNAQRVRRFSVLPRDFSLPGGELGPTLKIKRHVVTKNYAAVIERMYSGL